MKRNKQTDIAIISQLAILELKPPSRIGKADHRKFIQLQYINTKPKQKVGKYTLIGQDEWDFIKIIRLQAFSNEFHKENNT